MPPYLAKDPVHDIAEIRDFYRAAYEAQELKILDHIDPLCAAWIARSTFLVMSTFGQDGSVDASPKGDPPGFVQVLDQHTLAIPDRPGNHRFDSFENILETGQIGLVFLVPNRNEVVRVNGSAQIVRDIDVRKPLAINGRVPEFAIVVDVKEAFYHCGKAIIRSQLWSPDRFPKPADLPTYAEAILAHSKVDRSLEDMTAHLDHNDKHRLYDE